MGYLISFPIKVLLLLFVISHISFKVCVFLHIFCLLKLLFLCCLCFKNQLMSHNIVYPSTSFQAGKLPPFLFISLIIYLFYSAVLFLCLALPLPTHTPYHKYAHTTDERIALMNRQHVCIELVPCVRDYEIHETKSPISDTENRVRGYLLSFSDLASKQSSPRMLRMPRCPAWHKWKFF